MTPVTIQVNTDTCNGCGLCASVCPARVFDWKKGAPPEVTHAERCVLCGQCVAVCPSESLTHSRLGAEGFSRIVKRSPQSLVSCIRERRSVRNYRNKAISREVLTKVAESAGFAPTGAFGCDAWTRQVIIVSDPAVMRRVTELTAAYMSKLLKVVDGHALRVLAKFSDKASAGRSIIPDLKMRLERWEEGINDITYDAPVAMFVHAPFTTATPGEDTDAALMNMMLSAHALGLGSCWNGWIGKAATSAHVKGTPHLANLLGLPDTNRVVQAATFGWPRIKLHSLPPRETHIHWVGGE